MPARSRPDGAAGRALLYQQLAVLEHAGMPARQALQTVSVECGPVLARQLRATLQALAGRRTLDEAGRQAGLFLPWEAALLKAASEGGHLADGYTHLAQHYEQSAQRRRQLRTRMVMPLAVLALAFFVLPLPALVRGEFGAGGYLARSLLPLILLWAGWTLLRAALARAAASAAPAPGMAVVMALPFFGTLLRRLEQRHALAMLALLLRAGLPAGHALEIAAGALRHPPLRAGCLAAAAQAARGGSVVEALTHSRLCEEPQGLALIRSGEAAGRLDESLSHYTADLERRLNLQLDLVAEWAPRVFYFGLVVPFVLL